MNNIDYFETAQTIPMKPKGHFSNGFLGRTYRGYKKKIPKIAKSYKTRRLAIKKGDLGAKARFGRLGCSSYWW